MGVALRPMILLAITLLPAHASARLLKMRPKGAKKSPNLPRKKYRQEMSNYEDVQYSAEVNVGGQTIMGVLDTGSFEVMVFSTKCSTCGPEQKYDSTLSSSIKHGTMRDKASYGSGDAYSLEAWETISFGPLVAESQPFWEVIKAKMPVLESGHIAAIVGVGPPDTVREHAKEEVDTMQNQTEDAIRRGIPKFLARHAASQANKKALAMEKKATLLENLGMTEFSVCLSREKGAPGYFIWNDDAWRAPSTSAAFHTLPVQAQFNWGLKMTSVILRHRDGTESPLPHSGASFGASVAHRAEQALGCQDGCGALFDSGTSLIAAPASAIAEVQQMLEGFGNDCGRTAEMPDLVFTLDGREYVLPPESYIGEVTMDLMIPRWGPLRFLLPRKPVIHFPVARCKPLFMAMEQATQFGPMWILGMPFFRSYYTTFSHSTGGPPYEQKLHIATAGEGCTPSKKAALVSTQGGRVQRRAATMSIRTSQLRMSKWVTQASGHVHL